MTVQKLKVVEIEKGSKWEVIRGSEKLAVVTRSSKFHGSYEIQPTFSFATAWAMRKTDIIKYTEKLMKNANKE